MILYIDSTNVKMSHDIGSLIDGRIMQNTHTFLCVNHNIEAGFVHQFRITCISTQFLKDTCCLAMMSHIVGFRHRHFE